jgi:hypothetical protein
MNIQKVIGTSVFTLLVMGIASVGFAAAQAKSGSTPPGHLPDHGHTYGANPGHGGLPPGQAKHAYGNNEDENED